MMQEFMKLLAKKYQEQGGPKKGPEMEAKTNITKELGDILGEDMVGKIIVSSDSEEGLEKGLETATDVIKNREKSESKSSEKEEDESEMSAKDMKKHESSESEDEDERETKIAELERKLEELKAMRA